MTIIFNPRYNSSVFLTDKDCGLGMTYLGNDALLNELELRAGLTCSDTDHIFRVVAYMDAMTSALKSDSTLFYSASFIRDDYGTAELMMGWRDALVKGGWDGTPVGNSNKIQVLSKIEAHFNCPGQGDRWRALLEESATRPILRPSDRIEVQCRKEDLEPMLQSLFDNINAHAPTPLVEYHHTAGNPRYEILSFKNEYFAHEWIAAQNPSEKEDVVAEVDQALLGDYIDTLGKPGIGASDEGIGSVMRLLPLGLSLFKYPADIDALQSYLQSPCSPLGKLSWQLFNHICSEGGFGPEWDAILAGADKNVLKFIGMWERSKGLRPGDAPVKEVRSFVTDLNKWAGKHVNPGSTLNAQFLALKRQCEAILILLDRRKGDSIPVEVLCQWAGHICTPINISSDYARLGSMNIVDDVANIYSSVSHLIWFAATTDNTIPYAYDFLSPSEIMKLKEAGVLIPTKEELARLDRVYKEEGLNRCKEVTIVTCERISGTETVQSALLADLSEKKTSIPGVPVQKTETGQVNTDFGKSPIHRFNPSILDGFSRKEESYSSIKTLLMNPVDYLLDYVKNYRQYGIKEVSDLQTTEGSVAHAYIETLADVCGNDPHKMRDKHKKDYDALLDEVIERKGLILQLEKNKLEKTSFRSSLKDSVITLLEIIISNGLVIEGFEYTLKATLPNIGPVQAIIDCLLKDPSDGKYVIFDFKYNAGKTYQSMIEENRELQLAIYRKVVELSLGDVKFIGYYAIPRKMLYTPKNVLKPNTAIEEVTQKASLNIFQMAAMGFVFRWSQLKQGEAEEGEDLPLVQSAYFQQAGLYPLEENYDDKKKIKSPGDRKKARAYGDKNMTLKGGLK